MKSPKSKIQKNKERKIGEKRKWLIDSTGPNKDTRGSKMRGEEKKKKIKCSRAKDMNFPNEKAHQVFKTME